MMELRSILADGPDHQVSTSDTLAFLSSALPPGSGQRYRDIADAAGIHTRHAVAPLPELARLATVDERNALYARHALPLAERAAREALALAGTPAAAVDALIVTSSTGYLIPGLDCHLGARLGLRADARRVALGGLGCAGSVRAIGLAGELLRSSGSALVVAVELCSPWLQLGEASPEDMHSNLLFGDGVGAALLDWSAAPRGPAVIAHHSTQWPDSLDGRAALLTSTGLRHQISPRLPRLLAMHLRRTVADFLAAAGLRHSDLGFVVVNPSDPRLASAATELLDLPAASASPAAHVWQHNGNTLSVGPLHLLQQVAASTHPSDDALGLLIVLGPGITCDLLLMRWSAAPATTERSRSVH